MASENKQEKRETRADIVAAMYNDAELYHCTLLNDPNENPEADDVSKLLAHYARRIEAAMRTELRGLDEEVTFCERNVELGIGLAPEGLREHCRIVRQILKAALAAPARNCDEYDCRSDAEVGFVEQTGETDANPLYWQLFANWLFAHAAERKGECDEA